MIFRGSFVLILENSLDGGTKDRELGPVVSGLDHYLVVLDDKHRSDDPADGYYLIADGKAVAHFGDLLLLLLLRSDHCEIENHDHYNEKHRHKPGVGRVCGSVARRRRVEVCHYCVQHFILSSGILITK